MTPEEKNRLHIWWLLQQIKEENLATPSNSVVHFITGNADDDTENIPSTKKRNLLMCKFDEDLKIIKILEVEESNHYNGFTTTFFFKILQPKFDNTYKQHQTWAEYLKDPKGFQKKDITYIKARQEIIEKNINAIYANINYLDKAEKDGWEKKLDILQTIWTFYHSNGKPNNLRVPIKKLTIKDRTIYEIDGILEGLEKEGCSWGWHRGTHNYELEVIYPERLKGAYNRTKEVYEKFAKIYQEKSSAQNQVWLGITEKSEKNKDELLQNQHQEKTIKKSGYLITRGKDGDFYWKNKLIAFKNKDAIYYLVFECAFENGDAEGFCSNEIINKYLIKHSQEEYTDERQIKDRIKNGLVNLFRFSNLPPKAPNGKEIIQKVRGKGIVLYNPPL